jgi:hypothetical protein
MKKLNLEKLQLAAEDVLQRSQLAGIYGGSGGSGCSVNNCSPTVQCCPGDECSTASTGVCRTRS